MNMGNSANACSGRALPSKTACAAAQHRSSVSVSSMAASRISEGIRFCTSILRSNGFFSFMSGPFGGGCVRPPSYSARAARQVAIPTPAAFPGWSAVGGGGSLHPAATRSNDQPRMTLSPTGLERAAAGGVLLFFADHVRTVRRFAGAVTGVISAGVPPTTTRSFVT